MEKPIKNRSNEHRKIQVTGGSTYILSLPKNWIQRNQLKKGSLLSLIEEEDGSLSILLPKLDKKEKKDKASIKITEKDNFNAVIRKLISAYLVGYDMLNIKMHANKTLPPNLRNHIMYFARNFFVGTEIVIDSPSELTLQVLLNYPELTVQSVLSRMAIITSSMHKDALNSLKTLNHKIAKTVIETDREVNRFGLYVVRLLKLAVSNPRINKEVGLKTPRDCLGYRLIAKSIERTADHSTKIAQNTLLLNENLNNFTLQKIELMSTLSISMFEKSIQALFKEDFNLAESVIQNLSQIYLLEKEAVFSIKKVTIEEIANLRLIIESVRRTAEYACDISEVVLNLNVESILL